MKKNSFRNPMQRSCANCNGTFQITQDDLDFYEEVSPTFAGKKFQIPLPTLCPTCRLQRRINFRNERKLYHRKSDMSGKEILSIYAPEKPYKIFDQEEWWSDKWSPFDYGKDVDFSRPILEQLQELNFAVPHMSLSTMNVENSYYTNYSINIKDCYLIFGATEDEDVCYGKFVHFCKDSLDMLSIFSCELCYEGSASQDCYNCKFFTNARNCSDCMFIDECVGCKNCFQCFGLRNKEYYFQNKQLSKEEYEQKVAEIYPLTVEKIEELQAAFLAFKEALPHPHATIVGSEDCTGDMIFNSKNCKCSFEITESEDNKFIAFAPKTKNCYDTNFNAPVGAEWCYEAYSSSGDHTCAFICYCWYCSNVYYSFDCHHCKNCFCCVGLKNEEYCIFNRQYSKEEYEELVARIIKHMQETDEWGEYYPRTMSPFAYNESIAIEYFPLTKEEVLANGWVWRDEDEEMPEATKVIPAEKLPALINDIPDDILNWAIVCKETRRPFKIVKQELGFYRRMQLPIPHLHPDERHKRRMAQRNPRELHERKCHNCEQIISTTYSPSFKGKILCSDCYQKEVY